MAKKSVASPTTPATQKVSQSRTSKIVNISSALRYFWEFAEKSWEHATTYQAQLAARRPLYTLAYIATQVAFINTVKMLPENDVRKAKTKKTRQSLSAHRQAVMTEANLLDSAIQLTYANQAELIHGELTAAGITALRAATPRDWAAVSTFLTKATTYLEESGEALIDADAITADFASNLETVGEEFNAAKNAFTNQVEAAKFGTKSVADGVKKIKQAITNMQQLGKDVFEFEPELRRLFTAEYVLDEVRSTHPAHITGRTDLGPVVEGTKPRPLANMLVEVLGQEGKTATTDGKGRYKIQIAGGNYRMRFSGGGMVPVELNVTVEPGKGRRVNVVLEPIFVAELEAAMSKDATPPPAPMDDELENAMKEVTAAPTNGVGASQNGLAVA